MKNMAYKKEILISTLAIGVVSFILVNLQSPKGKEDVLNLTQVESGEHKTVTKSKRLPSSTKENVQKKKLTTFKEKMDYTFLQIKKVEICLEQECDYPDNDPREYSLSVYKNLSVKIAKYKKFWLKSWFKLSQAQQERIVRLLSHDDGHVKEELLSMLDDLPKEEAAKHLDLVLNDVIDYHDSKLIPTALDVLDKVKNPTTEVVISNRLSEALKQGGPHVSQEISKGISKFISPQTANVYEQALEAMPTEAPETTFLTSALSEFEMQQSGG